MVNLLKKRVTEVARATFENARNTKSSERVEVSDNSISAPASGVRVKWWHIAIGIALTFVFTILAPRGRSLEFAHLNEGSISPTKIIAPFDFEVLKSEEELKRERREAVNSVYPVASVDDSIRYRYTERLRRLGSQSFVRIAQLDTAHFSILDDPTFNLASEDSLAYIEMTDRVFNEFGFRLARETWVYLQRLYQLNQTTNPDIYGRYFEGYLGVILLDVYARGIVDISKDHLNHHSGKVMLHHKGEEASYDQDLLMTQEEASSRITSLLSEKLGTLEIPEGGVSSGYDILQQFIIPNIIYNAAETDRRRQAAIAKVPLARGLVQKDELIIDSNIKVTAEHVAKLNSLAVKRAELQVGSGGIGTLLPILGHAVLAIILIVMFGWFVVVVRPVIWSDWKLMLLVAMVICSVHVFQVVSLVGNGWSMYLFPIGVAVMLIAILVDRGVALGAVMMISLISGLLGGHDYPMVFSVAAVGGVALFAVKKVQNRGDVMRAGLYLAVIYLPIVAAFHAVSYTAFRVLGVDLLIACANSLITPILVLGLIYIFEFVFGLTTELTLLELVDLNRPLLRELALKSPGTYHHSIMVGSLAEAAARTIGANAVLTRAGAYYHDIGKMERREYFIENQESGSQNIHDRLSPEKSAQIVIEHVKLGLELADKYKLPPEVKAFISEHHGRSRLAYFYAKAKREQGEDISDANYRYPGPNPLSKETGILMLADLVEAAARSSEPQNADELREIVVELVKNRVAEGDLDQSPLTLREISLVTETFIRVLSGIHHQRIAYPGQEIPKGSGDSTAMQRKEIENEAE